LKPEDYVPAGQQSFYSGMRLYDASSDGLKTETFDSAALWERVNRDMELLRDLVDLFAEQSPALLDSIEAAIEQGSFADLQKSSHKLKGSLLQFSASQAAPIAAMLEEMGKNKRLEGAKQALVRLRAEIARLLPALHEMVDGDNPVI